MTMGCLLTVAFVVFVGELLTKTTIPKMRGSIGKYGLTPNDLPLSE